LIALSVIFMDELLPQSTADPAADRLLGLVHWMSAASRQLRRRLSLIAESTGLTDCELLAIWLCLQNESGLVQGDLAAAVGVSPAQMSGVVERLRQRGLIEMNRQTLDRRRQVWRGTPAARQMLNSLAAPLANLATGIDADLPPGDQHTALRICERLSSVVEAWPEDATGSMSSNVITGPTDGSPRKAA
jgi:DNA-binding MarR family transcriptional regulator